MSRSIIDTIIRLATVAGLLFSSLPITTASAGPVAHTVHQGDPLQTPTPTPTPGPGDTEGVAATPTPGDELPLTSGHSVSIYLPLILKEGSDSILMSASLDEGLAGYWRLDETSGVREKFAQLINADVGEIGLLSTTSEGENIVTAALDLRAGDNIIIDNLHQLVFFFLTKTLSRTECCCFYFGTAINRQFYHSDISPYANLSLL